MKKPKSTVGAAFALVLLSLALSGCDTQTQKDAKNTAAEMEDNADAVRAVGSNTADAIDDSRDRLDTRLDNIADNALDALENKAADVRSRADNAAETIENRADAVVKAAKGK